MPRKARSAATPVGTQTRPILEQDPGLSPIGRDANGRFARGNAGGPGNPHARHCARMLAQFRNLISDEKMSEIILVLADKAAAGDITSIKMVLNYKIGKPGPAPDPDGIERDEWNHFEQAAHQYQHVTELLKSIPSTVANDIVRGAWPVAAGAFADKLGRQLQPVGPAAPQANSVEGQEAEAQVEGGEWRVAGADQTRKPTANVGTEEEEIQNRLYQEVTDALLTGAPLPNRKQTVERSGEVDVVTSPATKEEQVSGGAWRVASEDQTPESTANGGISGDEIQNGIDKEVMQALLTGTPLPNRFSQKDSTARKKSKNNKKGPIPNRKPTVERSGEVDVVAPPATDSSSPATHHTPPATDSSSPTTRHTPPATTPVPLPNRFSEDSSAARKKSNSNKKAHRLVTGSARSQGRECGRSCVGAAP